MFKVGIVVCAICASAGGTFLWLQSAASRQDYRTAATGMPSLEELYAKAHAETLPDLTVKEPF